MKQTPVPGGVTVPPPPPATAHPLAAAAAAVLLLLSQHKAATVSIMICTPCACLVAATHKQQKATLTCYRRLLTWYHYGAQSVNASHRPLPARYPGAIRVRTTQPKQNSSTSHHRRLLTSHHYGAQSVNARHRSLPWTRSLISTSCRWPSSMAEVIQFEESRGDLHLQTID